MKQKFCFSRIEKNQTSPEFENHCRRSQCELTWRGFVIFGREDSDSFINSVRTDSVQQSHKVEEKAKAAE